MIKTTVGNHLSRALTWLRRPLSWRGIALRWVLPRPSRPPASGSPIGRFYFEEFLATRRSHIRGRAAEMGGDRFMRRFGQDAHTFDVLAEAGQYVPKATHVVDFADRDAQLEGQFNCIVGAELLQRSSDPRLAIQGIYRMLRPGGVLIASFSALPTLPADGTGGSPEFDGWRFTPTGVERCLAEVFGPGHVDIESYGNLVAATAALGGLSAQQVGRSRLAPRQVGCEVIICAIARKIASAPENAAEPPPFEPAPPAARRRRTKKSRPEAN